MKAKIQNIRTKSRRNKIPAAEIQGTPARQIHKELRFGKSNLPSFKSNCGFFLVQNFNVSLVLNFFSFSFGIKLKRGKYPTKELKQKSNAFLYWMLVLDLPGVLSIFFFCASPVHFRTWGGETSAFLGKIYLKLCSMGDVPCK